MADPVMEAIEKLDVLDQQAPTEENIAERNMVIIVRGSHPADHRLTLTVHLRKWLGNASRDLTLCMALVRAQSRLCLWVIQMRTSEGFKRVIHQPWRLLICLS